MRNEWAAKGVTIDLNVTQIGQGVVNGGKSGVWQYGGRGDLVINLDSQKLGLWPGGFFNLELEGNWASSVNRNTGALMPVNSSQTLPLPPGDIFGVPAWNFAQFLSPYFGLAIGKFATITNTSGDMNEFAHGKGATQFMNMAFNFNQSSFSRLRRCHGASSPEARRARSRSGAGRKRPKRRKESSSRGSRSRKRSDRHRAHLHKCHQRILGSTRPAGDGSPRTRPGGGRRLSGPRRLSGVPVADHRREGHAASRGGRPAAGPAAARVQRPRRHGRAARHRRRPEPRVHPRRVQGGTDIVSGAGPATAKANPDEPADIERHGTEMAGVIVGRSGPYGLRGIAPGATIFPARVAGWQRDTTGEWAVYGRTDQLIAGLEAAVDPNGDGDAHDAARVAVFGLAEPYISFADAPESRAVDGALDLDTLVVAPAGTTFPPAPRSAASRARAEPAERSPSARRTFAVRPSRSVSRSARASTSSSRGPFRWPAPSRPRGRSSSKWGPRGARPGSPAPVRLDDFFDDAGRSMVAGRAALVPAGASSELTVENAARAGAYAVLLYGRGLPAGALGVDENVDVPVVVFPQKAADRMLEVLSTGQRMSVSLGPPREAPNLKGDASPTSPHAAYRPRAASSPSSPLQA